MNKLAMIALAASAPAMAIPAHENLADYSYETYVSEFGKPSDQNHPEYVSRKRLFEERIEMMIAHNKKNLGWTMNVNKFADMFDVEINKHKGYKRIPSNNLASKNYRLTGKAIPKSQDYRDSPFLTPVKNQGGCGSCWAFSATESMEYYWNKHSASMNKTSGAAPVKLAPQQVVDCTPNPNHCGGTGGCSGATAELGFEYIIKEGGLTTEDHYEYTAMTGTCKDKNVPKVAKFSDYVKLPENNATALLDAVANIGVVSISVDASLWTFYSGGIFKPTTYKSVDIDHAVQAVGYGTSSSGEDYWIVRNSWGAGWGEEGYIRLHRTDGSEDYCGLDRTPQDGSGCTGGPSEVTCCGNSGIYYDTSYPIV